MAYTAQRRLPVGTTGATLTAWLNARKANVEWICGQEAGQTQRSYSCAVRAAAFAFADGSILDSSGAAALTRVLTRLGLWRVTVVGRVTATSIIGTTVDMGAIAVDANGTAITGARSRWTVPSDDATSLCIATTGIIQVNTSPCTVGADASHAASTSAVMIAKYLGPA